MKRLSIIISTMLFVAVSMMAQNQKQFVVADKNGNSPLVQSLIFQQQDANERFSWKSEGEADGYQADRDIEDLLFIARANAELATASSEEVTEMLEGLCGTDEVDATAVAAALQNNPNIVESFSEDGNNVCVKINNDEGYVMYPMYDLQSPFEEGSIPQLTAEGMARLRLAKQASRGSRGNVAIFNYFDRNDKYLQQNHMIGYIQSEFENHDYHVDYFGKIKEGEEKIFTQNNFEDVIKNSSQYKAIIIMTHGGLGSYGKSWIATRDAPTKNKDRIDFVDPDDQKKYRMIPVEETLRNVYSRCIVYIGACDGVPSGGFEKYDNAFPRNTQSCAIGWEGRNCIAQAHAALLFHYLLYNGFSVTETLNGLPDKDPKWYSQMHFSQFGGDIHLDGNEELRPKYSRNVKVDLKAEQVYVHKASNFNDGHDEIRVTGNWYSNYEVIAYRIYMRNALTGTLINQKLVITNKTDNPEHKINISWDMSNVYDGAYDIYIESIEDPKEKYRARQTAPSPVIVSNNFSPLYALPEIPEDMVAPKILGSDGQSVDEITLPAGTSKTYEVDAYEGHVLSTPCLDKNVAKVSISGRTLTVTGISEGSTYFGVYDKQNHQIAVAEVTVTAGGETPGPGGDITAYTSCPDDHHPHLIDLGLPSGTKWACCNVGASKPEDYGGYYAWGETEEKEIYNWSTYQYKGDIASDISGTQYDVAHVKWGGSWQIPTEEMKNELIQNTIYEWIELNGKYGMKITATNGASIFLPAGGFIWPSNDPKVPYDESKAGHFWASTPSWDFGHCQKFAVSPYGWSGQGGYSQRYSACTVRPVSATGSSNTPDPDNPNPNNPDASFITFADAEVASICIERWDTNGDSMLSMEEAAAVTDLGDGFYYDITSFDELQYFTGLTSIGDYVFSGCIKLTSVTLPNTIVTIGEQAFSGCSNLTSIIIPNSVTTIKNCAFMYCTGLTNITFPNSVTTIMSQAFEGCSSLSSLTIPNSASYIDDWAFMGCYGLNSITFHCNAIRGWFMGNQSIKEIVIGDEVTSIEDFAFQDCYGLVSVTIPHSVISIGENAFSGCNGLVTVAFHCNEVKHMYYGNVLKEVIIGDEVSSISDYAFINCTSLESVIIGNSVTSIGKSAFYGCTNLTSLTIGNSVKSIDESAFYDCKGITSVTIPNSIENIGWLAFYGCSSLTSVTFHCREIKSWFGENNIKEIVIGDEVTSIGEQAFLNFSGLTSVTIPNSVTSIGQSAFHSCTGLTSVTLPNSVITIGREAFYNCSSLISLTIPNSVTSIGYSAFANCSGLKEVYSYIEDPSSIGNNMFSYNLYDVTLYVPAGKKALYEAAVGWNRFPNIVEME